MSNPDGPSQRARAIALHRQGRLADALSGYESLLAGSPDDADILGLKALVLEQLGRAAEAEALLRRSLDLPTDTPVRLRNLNNLLVMLIEAGRRDDARALLASPPPEWPAAATPTPTEQSTLISLLGLLLSLDRLGDALPFVISALPHLPAPLDIAEPIVAARLACGDAAGARAIVERVDAGAAADRARLAILRGAVAHRAGHFEASADAAHDFAARLPVLIAPVRPGQRLSIAVLNRAPRTIDHLAPATALHFGSNLPSQLVERRPDRYRLHSVLADLPDADARELAGSVDLVLNNIVSGEMLSTPGMAERIRKAVTPLRVPILNDPAGARETSRVANSYRLQGLDGVVVPRILYFSPSRETSAAADLGEIERRLGLPVILRIAHTHMGTDTWRAETRAEVTDILARHRDMPLYAIQFVESRHDDGLRRLLRVGVVDGEPVLLRADYGTAWNMRARRNKTTKAFYDANPEMLDVANALVHNPDRILTPAVLDRLKSVVARTPLDIFGIDFDVMDDGRVLVFEANAAMNLLTTTFGDRRYPEEAEERFLTLLDDFLMRRAGGSALLN